MGSESDDGEERIFFGSGKNRRRHSAARAKRERERETKKERNPNPLFYLFRLHLTVIGPGSQKLNDLTKKNIQRSYLSSKSHRVPPPLPRIEESEMVLYFFALSPLSFHLINFTITDFTGLGF